MISEKDIPRLELESALGYSGDVSQGLHLHPDGIHVLYALGSCVAVREIANTKAVTFFFGHNDHVSCLTLSKSGRLMASGQQSPMGFQADICLFNFETRRLLHRMVLHKGKVQSLSFSCDESFLASVGGEDDKSIVVWDVNTGRPFCGCPIGRSLPRQIKFLNTCNTSFLISSSEGLKFWKIDVDLHRLDETDINMSSLRRDIVTIGISEKDTYAYCGTTSGDVLCAQLNESMLVRMRGPKKLIDGGVGMVFITSTGDVLVGGGGGSVKLLSKIDLSVIKETSVQGSVTSLSGIGQHFFIGTSKSNIYYLNGRNFIVELRQTCHPGRINDLTFPYGFAEVFATCGGNDIRVWSTRTCSELLRIEVSVFECNTLRFTKNGQMILSGWSDGKIRSFGPQSGRLLFAITDAHKANGLKRLSGSLTGVTAISADNANERIISGGADGVICVWRISGYSFTLERSMQEHKATVNDIIVNNDDTECISVSDDGSCILWDFLRGVRRCVLYAQTFFKAAKYFTDESQIITTGSERALTYWDTADGQAIRNVEVSRGGEVNTLDLSSDGYFIATGGADRVLRIWGYDMGNLAAIGLGHSGSITKIVIAPGNNFIVSVGEDGAILSWRVNSMLNIQTL